RAGRRNVLVEGTGRGRVLKLRPHAREWIRSVGAGVQLAPRAARASAAAPGRAGRPIRAVPSIADVRGLFDLVAVEGSVSVLLAADVDSLAAVGTACARVAQPQERTGHARVALRTLRTRIALLSLRSGVALRTLRQRDHRPLT